MSKALLNVWHEARYLEIVYSKLLEVSQGRKIAQGTPAEPRGSELSSGPRTDPESLDERKQTKFV